MLTLNIVMIFLRGENERFVSGISRSWSAVFNYCRDEYVCRGEALRARLLWLPDYRCHSYGTRSSSARFQQGRNKSAPRGGPGATSPRHGWRQIRKCAVLVSPASRRSSCSQKSHASHACNKITCDNDVFSLQWWDFRAVFWNLERLDKNSADIHRLLQKTFDDQALSRAWTFERFKRFGDDQRHLAKFRRWSSAYAKLYSWCLYSHRIIVWKLPTLH